VPTKSATLKQCSRSKLELYLECPRCFYDDIALGWGRPGSPPYTLNNAVDALFKAEFDGYRTKGQPHPLFATVRLDAVPFRHAQLDTWRSNFKGVRWLDDQTGWTYFGAIDDLWVKPDGTVIVADYKATAKRDEVTAEGVYPGYKRQLEIYQYLVEKSGFRVDARSWLVYANGINSAGEFGDVLRFRTKMIPVDGDRSWVEPKFREAVLTLQSGERPPAAAECKWCQYAYDRAATTDLFR
jgi:PD-(D/E)XK nuclease superfamily